MTNGSYDINGKCTICNQLHPCSCEVVDCTMHSCNDEETEEDRITRENEWNKENN